MASAIVGVLRRINTIMILYLHPNTSAQLSIAILQSPSLKNIQSGIITVSL